MTLYYPLRIVGDSTFVHILDQSGRAIAGGLLPEDAEEIVNALNSQPKRKSKKIQIEEALKRSDLGAQLAERDDIEWGHHDGIPRGEHVARLSKQGR